MFKKKLYVYTFILLPVIVISFFVISGRNYVKVMGDEKRPVVMESIDVDTSYSKDLDQHMNVEQEAIYTEPDELHEKKNVSTISWAANLILVGTSLAALLGAISIRHSLNKSE